MNFLFDFKNFIKKDNLYLYDRKNIDRFVDITTKGFQNYKLHKYFFGDENYEIKMKIFTKANILELDKELVIYTDSKEINSIVMVAGPNYKGSKAIPFILNGGYKLFKYSGIDTVKKLINYENHCMKLKKKYTNDNCLYLFNIAVDVNLHNRGIGKTLLNTLHNYQKIVNLPIFLETHSIENVKFYEKSGYELIEKNLLPGADFIHYVMIRKSII